MNERTYYDGGPRVASSNRSSFVLGALVGAGIALLLAPATGGDTRRRIGATARRWGGAARDKLNEAGHAAKGIRESAQSAIDAGREAYARGRGKSGMEERDASLHGGQPNSMEPASSARRP